MDETSTLKAVILQVQCSTEALEVRVMDRCYLPISEQGLRFYSIENWMFKLQRIMLFLQYGVVKVCGVQLFLSVHPVSSRKDG